MVIMHNLQAMNTNRQFKLNNGSKSKSVERLSSGYKINRSADDAAGLTISEKMRWQIRGLNRDVRNAQDGQSLIQVAEGAMNEMHDILQRMNELATQAANDTNTDSDRAALGKEIDQLKGEINRISKTTTFNTIKVLEVPQLVDIDDTDGTNKMSSLTNIPGVGNKYAKSMDFSKIDSTNKEELIGKSFSVTCSQNCSQVFTFSFSNAATTTASVAIPGDNHSNLNVNVGIEDTGINSGEDIVNAIYNAVAGVQSDLGLSGSYNYIGHANGIAADGSSLIMYSIYDGPNYAAGMGEIRTANLITTDRVLNLQVGTLSNQAIPVNLKTINCTTLGIGDLPVDSFQNAGYSMTCIQNAIDIVSEHRSYLGAVSNRLNHTIDNLNNAAENTQAAESGIRDTDMAETMVTYSADNILSQVGQSMLAQANQSAQGILSLLG